VTTTAKRQWKEVHSESEFLEAFTGKKIVETSTSSVDGADYIGADLYWKFSDGSWLAMEISTSAGCDTCGYGRGEKTYYRLPPLKVKP
jgi:hypothetical protein